MANLYEYVAKFYCSWGVYPLYKKSNGKPLNMNMADINKAIDIYVTSDDCPDKQSVYFGGSGDSYDREQIRKILEEQFGYEEVA